MAVLNATERAQVRLYLGYPTRFYDQIPALELAMNSLDAATEEDRTAVRDELAICQDIDTRITDALLRNKASKLGSITLNPAEIGNLRSEGRRHVARLARLLFLSPLGDAFSGGLPNHGNLFCTE